MKVSRKLRKEREDKHGRCPVELCLTWHQRRLRWLYGPRVDKKLWDAKKERLRVGDGGAILVNEELDRMEKLALSILRSYFERDINPEVDEVKGELMEALGRGKQTAEEKEEAVLAVDLEVVSNFWVNWIERNRLRYSSSILSIHRASLTLWHEVNPALRWGDVTQGAIENWVDYMIDEAELANMTIKKYLSVFNKILTEVRDGGVAVMCNLKNIYIDSYESIPVFLTIVEVRKIQTTRFSSENLQVVADAFVFAIASGLRFSDLVAISDGEVVLTRDENNEMVGFLISLQRKTSKPVMVTMTDLAVEIWMKYGGNPLRKYRSTSHRSKSDRISRASYRFFLRQMGKEAGIEQMTVKRRKVGNVWREDVGPKWQFMSSHVARHTFAMIGLELGVPIETLQKGLGHTDIASTLRYARINEAKASEDINKKWKGLNQLI